MLVRRSNIEEVLGKLVAMDMSIDTETTGLRAYHGDHPFSFIIGAGGENFYFNLQRYVGLQDDFILEPAHLEKFRPVFEHPTTTWYLANASFDLAMLRNIGIELKGDLWDVLTMARVEFNDTFKNSLASTAARAGLSKDDSVDEYIKEHKLVTKVHLPWRKAPVDNPRYDLVPFPIITAYGETDARITRAVGRSQRDSIAGMGAELPEGVPRIGNVARNERALSRVCFEMEWAGVQCDRGFSARAIAALEDKSRAAHARFLEEAKQPYSASGVLFSRLFESEKSKWGVAEKGGPSFDGDVLASFENPIAKTILEIKDTKSKLNFYHGFLYHMDGTDRIHPKWNQGGAQTGRFTSSGPNFQNLERPEEGEAAGEFTVRRAIVPPPGYVLLAPDFDQVEYRLMLEYACRAVSQTTPLVQKILGGLDVHSATAEVAFGSSEKQYRQMAKTVNFGTLYGQGIRALAGSLGVTQSRAKEIQGAIFGAAPEIRTLIERVIWTARQRKYVISWAGRRHHYPDPNFAYIAPNGLIQGGAADVTKFAMVEIDKKLRASSLDAKMIMTVHDQLVFEVKKEDAAVTAVLVKEEMERVFPHKYLPLTVGMMWSDRSLADVVKGMPA